MIMEKKQSFLINELLLNLKELPQGFYAKDNIEIRIFQNEHNEVIYEIKQDNIIINIKYSKGLDRYNSTLNISKDNINLSVPKLAYCTDNAAMIAAAGYFYYLDNRFSDYSLKINPSLDLDYEN